MRVLIAEDDQRLAALLHQSTTEAGWEVTSWLGESVSEAAARGVTSDHSPASEPLDE